MVSRAARRPLRRPATTAHQPFPRTGRPHRPARPPTRGTSSYPPPRSERRYSPPDPNAGCGAALCATPRHPLLRPDGRGGVGPESSVKSSPGNSSTSPHCSSAPSATYPLGKGIVMFVDHRRRFVVDGALPRYGNLDAPSAVKSIIGTAPVLPSVLRTAAWMISHGLLVVELHLDFLGWTLTSIRSGSIVRKRK